MGLIRLSPFSLRLSRGGTFGTDAVYDELFGLHHGAFGYFDVGHDLPQETAHAPALFTHEVGVVSRASFLPECMCAVSPHPVGSLYSMYDPSALQSEEGSVNRYPVEIPYFFPPPEFGVGNGTAEHQQMAQDYRAHRGDPQRYAAQ